MLSLNFDSDKPIPSNTTTIIGVTYNGGVIFGSTDNITQLTTNVFLCNCALGEETLEILLEDARNNCLDKQETARVVANTIGSILSVYDNNKKNVLQTGMLVGGWEKNGGGKLYEIGFGGVVMEKSNFAVGGYGVTDLNDFLEKEWEKGMNEEEAEQLVVKALSINNNACGEIQTATVNSKGVTRAFHPYENKREEELELEQMNEKSQLEGIRANLISLLRIQPCDDTRGEELELEHMNEKSQLESIRARLISLLRI